MHTNTKQLLFNALIILCLPKPIHAACIPINKVPVEVSKSGIYCLTGNLTDTRGFGRAVQITASHVTLDFQGFTLISNHGLDTGSNSSAISVVAKKYITLRNGTIRGFDGGILMRDNDSNSDTPFRAGHVIENMTILDASSSSISVGGDENIIRNNQIFGARNAQAASGILASGRRNLVKDNIVQSKNAAGITIGSYSIAEGNRLIGLTANNQPISGGIGSGDGFHLTLVDNIIVNGRIGVILKSGVLKNNIMVNTTEPYNFISGIVNITDGGGNIPALPK